MGLEAEMTASAIELPAPWMEPIEAYLDHLQMQLGASRHTQLAYRNDLTQAATFFQRSGLDNWLQLDPRAVSRFQATLGRPLAVTTAQRRLSSLRSFLKFLKQRGQGPAMDLPSTGGFRKPKILPKALPLEALEKLLAVPDLATPKGLRDRAMLELIYGAGLRVSEACELAMEEIDLDAGALRVTGKRGKTRYVPLPGQTIEWLRRYLESGRSTLLRRPLRHVFVSDRGLAMRRTTFGQRLQAMAAKADLPEHVSPHTLRHTYAVHLLKGGADLRAVQELLGHASLASTQVYTQLDLDEVRRKYRAAHPRR